MKIISNFNDYYDSCIGYGGIDNNIIFKRIQEEIYIKSNEYYTLNYNKYLKTFEQVKLYWRKIYIKSNADDIYPNYILLIVCGDLYPIIEISQNYYYSFNDFKNFYLVKINKPKNDYMFKRNMTNIEQLFNSKIHRNNINEYHRKLKSPTIAIFLNHDIKQHKILINPKLKDFEFHKIIDPFQMFQKLEMFISNYMIEVKPIIEISDEVKRDKRGFDNKSFKNM